MDNFDFQNSTRIIFGKDSENRVGGEVARIGKTVLLHYGSGSIKKSGLYNRVMESLSAAQVKVVELGGVLPNPRLSLVQKGIDLCRAKKVNCILAVGGGSVIDSAKAIGIGVPYRGNVWDFYSGKAQPEAMLPLATVLTIPAAGSEASSSSVITNEEGALKRGTGAGCMRPSFSILNPELSFTLPPFQTACGAADIMAHVMERYFTNTKETDFTDRLCESTLQTMIKNAPLALTSPKDYDVRAEIMWAGCVAHNDLLGTGRAGDWGSHDIEHELSGIYDVAHGAGLSVVFPAWMTHVYKHDLNRFVQFANRVWNVEIDINYPERTALAGIARLKAFFSSIGLPTNLAELKVPDDRLDEMAKKATKNGTIGNFVPLKAKDVLAILKLAR